MWQSETPDCEWLGNLQPAPQGRFSFDEIPFAGHPEFAGLEASLAVSRQLTETLEPIFTELEAFLCRYPRAVQQGKGVLGKLRHYLRGTPDRFDTVEEFRCRSEFIRLNEGLSSARAAIRTRLSGDELSVFDAQYSRFELEIFRYIIFHFCRSRRQVAAGENTLASPDLVERLERTGIVNARLGGSARRSLFEVFAADIDRVRSMDPADRKIGEYDRAVYYEQSSSPHVYARTENILRNAGVFSLAGTYTGLEMGLNRVTLHYAAPGDQHVYQTFGNPSLNPRTLNFHMDPKAGLMKLIIYLNQPGESDGPFSYVPGSPTFRCNLVRKLAAKANSVTNYLQSGVEKSAFLKLPEPLRANALFGSMLTDGSIASDEILRKEVKLTYEEFGDLFLFDPEGIHRGGLCREDGNRIALQIALRPIVNGKLVPGL